MNYFVSVINTSVWGSLLYSMYLPPDKKPVTEQDMITLAILFSILFMLNLGIFLKELMQED